MQTKNKYPVSVLCRILKLSRSSFYYQAKEKTIDTELVSLLKELFRRSRNNYGSRKIQKELQKKGVFISRRKICKLMKENGLVSSYSLSKYKKVFNSSDSKVNNVLNWQFSQPANRVIVSDLTYVRVGNQWNYICVLLDLFNREIVGYGVSKNKDQELVYHTLCSMEINISQIQLFHSDRGKEFDNQKINRFLDSFMIERSLSRKATPYDNAVAEVTFKIIKTEFVKQSKFNSIDQLKLEFSDYVNWFNSHRIHSFLGYLSPREFRIQHTLKNSI